MSTAQCAIDIQGNKVIIEVVCRDVYEAEVLFDDLTERMRSGDGISLGILPKNKKKLDKVKKIGDPA